MLSCFPYSNIFVVPQILITTFRSVFISTSGVSLEIVNSSGADSFVVEPIPSNDIPPPVSVSQVFLLMRISVFSPALDNSLS